MSCSPAGGGAAGVRGHLVGGSGGASVSVPGSAAPQGRESRPRRSAYGCSHAPSTVFPTHGRTDPLCVLRTSTAEEPNGSTGPGSACWAAIAALGCWAGGLELWVQTARPTARAGSGWTSVARVGDRHRSASRRRVLNGYLECLIFCSAEHLLCL